MFKIKTFLELRSSELVIGFRLEVFCMFEMLGDQVLDCLLGRQEGVLSVFMILPYR